MKRYYWKVTKDGRFVGYTTASTKWEALVNGAKQYGCGIWVEKAWEENSVLA